MGAFLSGRRRSAVVPALALGLALFAGSTSSEAQVLSRLSARLEGSGSLLVSSPQSDLYGFGFAGRLELGARVAGPAHVRAFGQFMSWSASDSSQAANSGPGQAMLVGAGLSIEPELASRVRLRADLDLGVSLNGSASDARFTWGLGVGAWFGLADVFDLGPIVRVGSILAADSESADNGGPGSAYFITFGLGISLHGAEERPAPPPPDDNLNRTIAAPPETTVTTTQTVTAPVVTAPIAPPVQVEVPPPPPTPAPPPMPLVETPAPPAAPVAVEAEEGDRRGRHGRRSRHGRGSRRGGSRRGGSHRRHR